MIRKLAALPAWPAWMPRWPGRRTPTPIAAGGRRSVPLVIAPMVYLAFLATALALALAGLADRWQTGLAGSATVEVPPPEDGSGISREVRLVAVTDVLQGAPAVLSVHRLDDEEIANLVAPWLDRSLIFEDLPLPDLIDIRLAPGAADIDALAQALDAAAEGTTIDNHAAWLSDLMSLTGTVQFIAWVAVLLTGAAAVATVVVVTRAELAIHHGVTDVLHVMGATDGYIAGQFQRHAVSIVASGALIGTALGAVTLALLSLTIGHREDPLLPGLRLDGNDWLVLASLPLATALLAAITARVIALRTLVRLP